jgi:hypothetical protein
VTLATRSAANLSALERAIVESVAYSDVFDFPVTAEEIRRTLPLEACAVDVASSLAALSDFITVRDGYSVLRGRENLIETRLRRTEASRTLMGRAAAYGRLIGGLPFVRMVGVTGSLAVDNAEAGDDIDYLVLTTPGRVWLARALTIAVVRLAGLRGLTLCPNYVLAEDALALPERDSYTARELLQMQPVSGQDVYVRMLEANPWCLEQYPNWHADRDQSPTRRGVLRRLAEAVLGGRLGNALERRLLRRKGRELAAQGTGNGEAVFNEQMCKGHFEAHRSRLEAALAQRMRALELEP